MSLRVTVELLPGGDESRAEVIGDMYIHRQHKEQRPVSRYRFARRTRGYRVSGDNVEHERSQDVWELIRSILNHSEPHPGYCHTCHRENAEDKA